MPRNRYTKTIRKEERARIAHQEKELESWARELRLAVAESTAVVAENEMKVRRSARLEQKRRHKPVRRSAATQVA
jgi:hypothetical protein